MTLICTLSIIINAQEIWVYLMAALMRLMRNCLEVKNFEKFSSLLNCFSCFIFAFQCVVGACTVSPTCNFHEFEWFRIQLQLYIMCSLIELVEYFLVSPPV